MHHSQSVECATASSLVPQGLWTNMGHPVYGAFAWCQQKCTFNGLVPEVVISVREPYSFYRSLFTYGWKCQYAAVCVPYHVSNFSRFMEWIYSGNRNVAQSRHVANACGTPCAYDHVLHTESLGDDWIRLVEALALPRRPLPWANPTSNNQPVGRGPPPPTVFTSRVVEIINELEANMFDEFGYEHRQAPFELSSHHHDE